MLKYLTPEGNLTAEAIKHLDAVFDPEKVTFKPQATNYKDKTALVAAYSDKRTYERRLDEVFGRENWSERITQTSTSPYRSEKVIRGKNGAPDVKEIKEGHKIFVTCQLTVNGLYGTKESTGTSETDDDNSVTTAEAQAFKRCCSMLGVGRYFYDIPMVTVGWEYGKLKGDPPRLPDWAYPDKDCADCSNVITKAVFKDNSGNVQEWSKQEVARRAHSHFGVDLCMDCMRKRKAAASATTKGKK